MTKHIQMVPDNNSVWALTACLQGCNVYPSSYNKNSTSQSVKNPENRLSQALSRNTNLSICLGLSRVIEKTKNMPNYEVNKGKSGRKTPNEVPPKQQTSPTGLGKKLLGEKWKKPIYSTKKCPQAQEINNMKQQQLSLLWKEGKLRKSLLWV